MLPEPIQKLIDQVPLPADMTQRQREALQEARAWQALYYSYFWDKRNGATLAEIYDAYDQLTELPKTYLSRAGAEIKFAQLGEVYPYWILNP
jgi:hypothetical protein